MTESQRNGHGHPDGTSRPGRFLRTTRAPWMRAIRTIFVLVAGAVLGSAPAEAAKQIQARITADNAYVFGTGSRANFTSKGPKVVNAPSGIFGCPAVYAGPDPIGANNVNGAEKYGPFLPGNNDRYLYLVTWSDQTGEQGVLGDFTCPADPLGGCNPTFLNDYTSFTGGPHWEVCATGEIIVPGPPMNDGTITSKIAQCNRGGNPPETTSVGWVSAGGDLDGPLAFGENNSAGEPDFPLVSPCINPLAKWMWYGADTLPGPVANPFIADPGYAPDTGHKEWLIFRTPISDVTVKMATNLEIVNNTGSSVNDLELIVKGHYMMVQDHFDGFTTIVDGFDPNHTFHTFTIVPAGDNTIFRWSDPNVSIPNGGKVHIGVEVMGETSIVGISWTLNGAVKGCMPVVSAFPYSSGEPLLTITNAGVDCTTSLQLGGNGGASEEIRGHGGATLTTEAPSLYVGNFEVEWFSDRVDLADLNATSTRSPIRADSLEPTSVAYASNMTSMPIPPGGSITVPTQGPPQGARHVMVKYTVSPNADLSGPGNTTSWVENDINIADAGTIPTLSEWGIVIMVLLLMGSGLYLVGRRRAQQTS